VDKENLDADLNNEMSSGIDKSKLVVTRAYIDKVQGYGRRGLDENCKAEFEYALRRHGTRRMVVVVMDPSCLDTSTWTGAVGFRLGSQIYLNLSDELLTQQNLASLVEATQRRLTGGGQDAGEVAGEGSATRKSMKSWRMSSSSFSS
jgi:hypothetical protein